MKRASIFLAFSKPRIEATAWKMVASSDPGLDRPPVVVCSFARRFNSF